MSLTTFSSQHWPYWVHHAGMPPLSHHRNPRKTAISSREISDILLGNSVSCKSCEVTAEVNPQPPQCLWKSQGKTFQDMAHNYRGINWMATQWWWDWKGHAISDGREVFSKSVPLSSLTAKVWTVEYTWAIKRTKLLHPQQIPASPADTQGRSYIALQPSSELPIGISVRFYWANVESEPRDLDLWYQATNLNLEHAFPKTHGKYRLSLYCSSLQESKVKRTLFVAMVARVIFPKKRLVCGKSLN